MENDGVICPSSALCLSSAALMEHILSALDEGRPLAVVSMGATEAFVMAQYTIFPESEIMSHPEAIVANMGIKDGFYHRGIRLPNLEARDAAVEAVHQADILGYNLMVTEARELGERVLKAYDIKPTLIFEAHMRRVIMFSQKDKFAAMLQGRKLLLISSQAARMRAALLNKYRREYRCQIVAGLKINDYSDMERLKQEIMQYSFDLCLLAAGTNALILAPFIARKTGAVAFDLGSGLDSLVTGRIVMDGWLADIIGVDRLLSM